MSLHSTSHQLTQFRADEVHQRRPAGVDIDYGQAPKGSNQWTILRLGDYRICYLRTVNVVNVWQGTHATPCSSGACHSLRKRSVADGLGN